MRRFIVWVFLVTSVILQLTLGSCVASRSLPILCGRTATALRTRTNSNLGSSRIYSICVCIDRRPDVQDFYSQHILSYLIDFDPDFWPVSPSIQVQTCSVMYSYIHLLVITYIYSVFIHIHFLDFMIEDEYILCISYIKY